MAKQRKQAESGDEAEEGDQGDGTPVLDEDNVIEALTRLAELDGEAAAAYAVAGEALEDDVMRAKIAEFREDHLRHVRDLNEVLEGAGASAVEEELEPDEAFLGSLTDMAAALGPKGLLVAMIANEMLTNGTYETALDLPCPDEIKNVLERNFADEQRHLQWLLEARDQLGVQFPAEPALSS
jgi:rubrerythrin